MSLKFFSGQNFAGLPDTPDCQDGAKWVDTRPLVKEMEKILIKGVQGGPKSQL